MNEADKHFGTKPDTSMPSASPTDFARYPDVQELCDTFATEMGWKLDNYTIRQIAAGARDFKQAIGNKPDVLLHAIKKMRKEGLTIASPRSCITTCRRMGPDPDSEAFRSKYKNWED